jgi:anti-sigma B factor antagonist
MTVYKSPCTARSDWETSRLSVEVTGDERWSTIRIDGEIDMNTVDVFADAAQQALRLSPLRLVVDVSGIDFLGVAGLRVLLQMREQAEAAATDLVLLEPSPNVRYMMDVTGTTELFRVLDARKPAEPANRPLRLVRPVRT